MVIEDAFVNLLNWWTARRRRPDRSTTAIPDGWFLGTREGEGETPELVLLEDAEMALNLAILGAPGMGKSRFIELIVRHCIKKRAGFCLVDPHGDLTTSSLAFLYQEYRRAVAAGHPFDLKRCYLVEPFRDDAVIGLSPLDSCGGPLYPHITEVDRTLRRSWATLVGPRMQGVSRNTLLALALAGLTLADASAFLSQEELRRAVVARVSNPAVREYWEQFEQLSPSTQQAAVLPVISRIDALVADPLMRAMLGSGAHTLHFRRLMDEGAWVFCNLSKGHLRETALLLGSFLVAQIQSAALGRADLPEQQRRPFTLLVDEFQNFVSDDFETILSEARKYRLRLVVGHQYMKQLSPELQSALASCVGTRVLFSVSAADAAAAVRGLETTVSPGTLVDLPVGCALVQRRGRPLARTRIAPVLTPPVDEGFTAFCAQLRRQHGRPLAEIEAEIAARRQRILTGTDPGGSPAASRPHPTPAPATASAAAPPAAAPGKGTAPLPEADDD